MCRSIKKLRGEERPQGGDEFQAAARQFVRKITGFQKPSRANSEAFEHAIAEIAATSQRLVEQMETAGQGAGRLAEAQPERQSH